MARTDDLTTQFAEEQLPIDNRIPLLTNNPDVVVGEGEYRRYISPEEMDYYASDKYRPPLEEGEGYATTPGGGVGIVSPGMVPGDTSGIVRGEIPQKPSDVDMAVYDDWLKFKDKLVKDRFGGKDPTKFDATEEWNRVLKAQIDEHGDRPEKTKLILENAKREMTVLTAKKAADATEIEHMRGWFEKDARQFHMDKRVAETQKEIAERQTIAQEAASERQDKTIQAAADRQIVALEGKLQEGDKQELITIRSEKNAVRRSMAGKEKLYNASKAMKESDRAAIQPQIDEYEESKRQLDELTGRENGIIGKYAGKIEKQPITKTVNINGKEYKDGDVVTRDGKKYRVRIK